MDEALIVSCLLDARLAWLFKNLPDDITIYSPYFKYILNTLKLMLMGDTKPTVGRTAACTTPRGELVACKGPPPLKTPSVEGAEQLIPEATTMGLNRNPQVRFDLAYGKLFLQAVLCLLAAFRSAWAAWRGRGARVRHCEVLSPVLRPPACRHQADTFLTADVWAVGTRMGKTFLAVWAFIWLLSLNNNKKVTFVNFHIFTFS